MKLGRWLTNKTHWLDLHVREATAAWSVLTHVFLGMFVEHECNTGAYIVKRRMFDCFWDVYVGVAFQDGGLATAGRLRVG